MKILIFPLVLVLLSCDTGKQDKKEKKKKHKDVVENATSIVADPNAAYNVVAELPKKLKEISGIKKDGDFIWAISDNPKASVYKLDLSGKVVQEVSLKIPVSDVEDVTTDGEYLYIADIGDNDGSRKDRQVIKIKKSTIGTGDKVQVDGEVISFSFPANKDSKKKDNDFDCEAIMSYNDALYLFTKRRGDTQTELFRLSKAKGQQTPQSIGLFNSEGLITGATINEAGNEVALVGYQKGHHQPFIWLLNGFNNSNFFTGKQQKFILENGQRDWQVESITYKDDQSLMFASEETPDDKATLYSIDKSAIK